MFWPCIDYYKFLPIEPYFKIKIDLNTDNYSLEMENIHN